MSIHSGHALPGMELGSCRIIRNLGHSNIGTSFLAQHAHLQEQVIVEVVTPPYPPLSPDHLALLLAQFRNVVSRTLPLAHPHILPILEYGEQDGLAYLVKPYLKNTETLKELMRRTGPLPLSTIRGFLGQLTDALTYAHTQNIMHGNITSAHVLVKDSHILLLTEFGIAQIREGIQADPIAARWMKGESWRAQFSPYMAPEQLLHGKIDTYTDIYSVGILLYEMITGSLPFTATSSTDLLLQHLQHYPPSLRVTRRDLPEVSEQVILRAIAQLPEDRYRQAADLQKAFYTTVKAAEATTAESAARAREMPEKAAVWKQSTPLKTIAPGAMLKNLRLKADIDTSFPPTRRASPIAPRSMRKLFSLSAVALIASTPEKQVEQQKVLAGTETSQKTTASREVKHEGILHGLMSMLSKLKTSSFSYREQEIENNQLKGVNR